MATQVHTQDKGTRAPQRKHEARLDFRLPREAREQIERAALVSGQSLSDFAAGTLVREAAQVLSAYQTTTLSDRDRDLFLALLDSEEGPNDALREAHARYLQGSVVGGTYFMPVETAPLGESVPKDAGQSAD